MCLKQKLNEFIKGHFLTHSSTPGWLVSKLSILTAERLHSGVYSCSVSNSTSAIVDVQILNGTFTFLCLFNVTLFIFNYSKQLESKYYAGETPAAVQSNTAATQSMWRRQRLLFGVMLMYISCYYNYYY